MKKNPNKRRIKPMAFVRRYGRVILGGFIIAIIIFLSVFADYLTDWDPEEADITAAKLKPGVDGHFLGTDIYGRDMWSRALFGSRTTLIVSIGAVCLTMVMGTSLGLLCGYYKRVEKVVMRFLDAFSTIPGLLLTLMMVAVFGAGVFNLMVAMSIGGVPGLARTVRNQVLSLREKEYIESEKAMGASDLRTVVLHIMPACSSYLLIRFSASISGSILSMTSLSYLGVGLDPTLASWGGMVQNSQKILFTLPHTVLVPSLFICVTAFGFTMLGEGLRDILDPKTR